MMDHARKLPPVWVLGMANLPLGICGGLALLTVPQLLAARHVPEPTIAGITSLGLLAATGAFLLGPLLDVWFSRRVYAVIATLLSAASTVVALPQYREPRRAQLGGGRDAAVSGDQRQHHRGLVRQPGIEGGGRPARGVDDGRQHASASASSPWWRSRCSGDPAVRWPRIALAAPVLIPLLIYAFTPAPGPDKRLAGESFGRFARRCGSPWCAGPCVWQLLLLFGAPSASFALTNTLGGLGRDYHASEGFVGIVGGAAVTLAGIFGSLIVPPLARRAPGRVLYLTAGVLGGLFTLSLIVLPHTPTLFAVAMVGENIAQSAALTLVSVLALQSLGEDNPLAVTQYGLLNCASNLPITYMQWVDGHAYGAGGLKRMYLTDGGLGLVACVTLGLLLALWGRKRTLAAARA